MLDSMRNCIMRYLYQHGDYGLGDESLSQLYLPNLKPLNANTKLPSMLCASAPVNTSEQSRRHLCVGIVRLRLLLGQHIACTVNLSSPSRAAAT